MILDKNSGHIQGVLKYNFLVAHGGPKTIQRLLLVKEPQCLACVLIQYEAVKGVLHLWALFLKVLCIFSKNKATSDKVSYGSGQKCSKELKNHNFTSV